MTMKLNRDAYEDMIAGDIAFLEKHAPPAIERTHIKQVLLASADHEYGRKYPPLSPEAQAICRRVLERGGYWLTGERDAVRAELDALAGKAP